MWHVQSYEMFARADDAVKLLDCLSRLAATIESLPGCCGSLLLQDTRNDGRVQFFEFWIDKESRDAAGSHLPKDIMSALMASIDGKPASADWQMVRLSAPAIPGTPNDGGS